MGAIARKCKARAHKAARQMEFQRIGPARARRFRGAQMCAEAARKFGLEFRSRRVSESSARWFRFPSTPAKTDCPSSAISQTDRREEMFIGHAIVRASHVQQSRRCRSADRTSRSTLMPCASRIAKSRPSAATASARARFRHSTTARRSPPPSCSSAVIAAGEISVDVRACVALLCRGGADMAVLDDAAQRLADLAMIEMQREGRGRAVELAVGDQDVVDGLGMGIQIAPTRRAPDTSAPRHRRARSPGRRIWHRSAAAGAASATATFIPPCASARASVRPTMPPPPTITSVSRCVHGLSLSPAARRAQVCVKK